MMKMNDLEVGQAWLITNNAKRVARILSLGEVEVEIPSTEHDKPPTKEMRKIATALICTPARPIPGHVDSKEADQGLVHRLRCKNDFDYDTWQETWIETARHPVVLEGKPHVNEEVWEWILKVHEVNGRAARHEEIGACGKLGPGDGSGRKLFSGTVVDGVLIPPEDVHPQLFDEIGVNEKTQAEINQAAYDQNIINEYVISEAAKAKESRKGNAAEYTGWKPFPKLRAQARICGLPVPGKEDGDVNQKLRTALATYLPTIGVNPWDVMLMDSEEFALTIEEARGKMMQ